MLKFKELLKKDGTYLLTGIIFIVINILIATVTFHDNANYTLNLPNSMYGLLSYAIILIFGIAGIILFRNVDRKNIKLEKIYLILVIPLGILYCLANPLGKVPDEDYHVRKSMAIAQGNLFSHAKENGDAEDEFNVKLAELVTSSTASYEEALIRINMEENDETTNMWYTTMALYAPVCHMPQAFGIIVARVLGGNLVVQCYFARLMNFAVAVFLVYQAIKLVPFKKHVILFISMLPIVLNEFASMASDALAIAISIFFICYTLYLKYNKEKIMRKDVVILTISSIVVALCKIVYIPLVFLLFILPKEKFDTAKKKNIITTAIVAVSIILNLIWLVYCSRFLIMFNPGVNSGEQVKYVLSHPFRYILILFRTLNTYGQMFIVHLCGEGLGHFNVQTSVLYVFPCIVIASMLFFINEDKEKVEIDKATKCVAFIIFLMIVALIYTSLYVQWTKLGYSIIEGIQARYFIPILPLVLLVVNNNKIVFSENLSKRYLLLFILFFNLNAITSIMYTYFYGIIETYIK